jgi:SSS family solute:Na+ symporter
MLNSTSTIFTLDLYKPLMKPKATEKELVTVGRITALVALIVAMFAAKPLLGGLDQAFQYIQEYTGFIYPGVVVVFGMGILWKRATNRAGLWTTILTIPMGILMKVLLPGLPFIIRMGYVCMALITIAVVLTLTDKNQVKADPVPEANAKKMKSAGMFLAVLAVFSLVAGLIWGTTLFGVSLVHLGFNSIFMLTFLLAFLSIIMYTNAVSTKKDGKAYDFQPELFKTNGGFLLGASGIVVIIVGLYAYFW